MESASPVCKIRRMNEANSLPSGLDAYRTTLVTGQLADKPTRGQSSRGLDNSRTGQLAEMFDLKFGVYLVIKALSVLSDGLHYLHAANIRYG